MTPAARAQTAIELLDQILTGAAAEQALTGWARRSRFAGSKDRAAIRDHVFDALRCKRSFAALGGAMTGRGLMLGASRASGQDPDLVFTGQGYGPAVLTPEERAAGRAPEPGAEAGDIPDWLWPRLVADHLDAEAIAQALRSRAPVHLRVNLMRASRAEAISRLADAGIASIRLPSAPTALELTDGARKLRHCAAYLDGIVELQDAASQAVVHTLPLQDGMRVLDLCAGGGGKTLAMAARVRGRMFAHDVDPARMQDIPARAARAHTQVSLLQSGELSDAGPFDLVLCDAPCSGSGAWRRSPDGKWRLTNTRLEDLTALQDEIIDHAATLVAPGGVLAYATCSILSMENGDRIAAFLDRAPGWRQQFSAAWTPDQGTDGFFSAHLTQCQG